MMLSAAIVVALNSGLRLREQLDMTWEDIDLARKVARVAAARAKGRKTREVVLLDPAVSVLRAIPRHIKSRFVFWHRDGARFRHFDRGFKARPGAQKLSISAGTICGALMDVGCCRTMVGRSRWCRRSLGTRA